MLVHVWLAFVEKLIASIASSLRYFLFFISLRVQRLCNFRSFSAWNVTRDRDVSSRKTKKPAASSYREFLWRVKGKREKSFPWKNFVDSRKLCENCTGGTNILFSFFSFPRSISALGSLRRAAKESLRASFADICI